MADGYSGNRDETYDRLVRQEELILEVTERLTEALQETGVTRAELARRLGRTPGFVSQVLGGGRNLTLRTIADIAVALDLRPAFKLSPDWEIGTEKSPWPDKTRAVDDAFTGAASAQVPDQSSRACVNASPVGSRAAEPEQQSSRHGNPSANLQNRNSQGAGIRARSGS